jgi:hypothetical protein
LALVRAQPLAADEGLWLFNEFPVNRVKAKYGFEVTPAFLDHIRLSSTRLYPYGSGSFVSPRGLVFTNHHVASNCIQKLTTAEHNYMRDGFLAKSLEDEQPCPDLEVNVLLHIEDVTGRVKGAAPPGTAPTEANRLRKAEMSRIEKACAEPTGDRCDVVTLFSGGQYHLYRYKRYTDIRLVFAPEESVAAFGGDPDNFTYPRYCLDFTFLRVYENGRPAATKDHLRWSREGVRDGELTFVPGHPGTTGRLQTYAALEFSRDVSYPLVLSRVESAATALEKFSALNQENKRIARDDLLTWQNSRKAYRGFYAGLKDPRLMARKLEEEKKLRSAIEADPRLRAEFGAIWDEVAAAHREYAAFYARHYLLERQGTGGSSLLEKARQLLRYAEEKAKPNEARLREYSDAALATVEQSLFSPAPIDDALQVVTLTNYFELLAGQFGSEDPLVRQVLAGRSPAAAAGSYVGGSKLKDSAYRKQLASSADAVRGSADPMIRLARILDGPAREARKRYEDRVEAVLDSSAARIAQARFAVMGAGDYPDATFTLRLSYGPVKGYRDAERKAAPYATLIDGLFRRATGREPFALPPNWIRARRALNRKTPYNFVTTNDTHGGNSGSPTLNTKGEIVGILFDGNIESLPNRVVYTEELARSVHVASQGILEVLRKVYRAERLLAELGVE